MSQKVESVLLVGEASGVHRNLAKALRTLGVEVTHMVQSDAPVWKWYDGVFAHSRPGWRGGVARNLEPFLTISKLDCFDVINFVNTITAVHGLHTRYLDLPLLRRKARVMSYYALGCDELALIRRNPILPYSPCEGCLKFDKTLGSDCENQLNPKWDLNNERARRYFDYGASSMIEYDHTSELFDPRHYDRIIFPIDIDKITFTPATPKERPLIVHTPTRRGFKGTRFVLEAIELLKAKRDDFVFEIIEGLAYDEYIRRVHDADIVIDQLSSQSPGMNGLEMLAAGKVVFTGATPLGRSFVEPMADLPAFDASPDPTILARDLAAVLDRKDRFAELAAAGRAYIREHHDPITVARKFLAGWERTLADQTTQATGGLIQRTKRAGR